MSSGKFDEFKAYRLVFDLFGQVVADMDEYMPLHRLVSQQLMHRIPSDMVKEGMTLTEEINRMCLVRRLRVWKGG